ncbi:LD-carboxypeptidase [Aequorivita sp. H23M31]|uniref:LD-carboxypeptidase n=1 Tax=Aequorivita ciconiae TaxID=2494375 RepID=A0A410G591_9FLAO|nr:LD-carboxypeptidase [Aequorivita sp. H23M31]QAA82365.1 LD-carboxypeptidase [Aequorivita sp. H23M31]
MISPPNLKKGDLVGIVSTARRITRKELETSKNFVEKWGIKIVWGKSIDAEENQYAGSDALRIADFQEMLDNPEIKAIWCAKGGYGTVRIIDKLDFTAFKKSPKWIIGYSDVTVLHSHIHNLGVETLHAQILLGIETKPKKTAESIRKVLFGEAYSVLIEKPLCGKSPHSQIGSVKSTDSFARLGMGKGELVGGNLSILYSLCGSNSAINTDGKILFIEDLDEYLYHIDRMMMNLKRNGMLSNLAGLIVGGMTEMHDNIIPFGKSAEEIVFDAVKEYDYPVCFDFPAGHLPDNRALIMGRKVDFRVQSSKVYLQFLESEIVNQSLQ